MLSKRPRSMEELSVILVGTGVTALKMWKDSPFEKVIVLASMNDTFKIGACRSRGQCQAQLSCRGSLVRWVESWSQFTSLLKVIKKFFVYFSFMLLNWVMQPFILLPGTGHIRLKLSTRLPLLCELKCPLTSPLVSPLEVQSYVVPMFFDAVSTWRLWSRPEITRIYWKEMKCSTFFVTLGKRIIIF